jgi:carbon starvation protein CstA
MVSDFLHINQQSIPRRLMICLPLFAVTAGILCYSLADAQGFKIIWRYFAWCNQTLSVFTLWAITVYLTTAGKNYFITLFPALFMTCVCTTYLCIAPEGLSLPSAVAYSIGGLCTLIGAVLFIRWKAGRAQR